MCSLSRCLIFVGEDSCSPGICAQDSLGGLLGCAHRAGLRQVHGCTHGMPTQLRANEWCIHIRRLQFHFVFALAAVKKFPPPAAEALHAMLQDHSSEAYSADLSLLHEAAARRLRQLCQSNGGVYIKAAQLLSTAQTIPQEYRK
jgi:hypothetical protein